MTTSWLTWQITMRSAFRILALGALFGGIYGPSVLIVLLFTEGELSSILERPWESLNVLLLAAGFGAFIGAVVGFVVGALIGFLISAITIRAFRPLHDTPRYIQVVQWSSALTGGIATLVGVPLMWSLIFSRIDLNEDLGLLTIFGFVPALLAGLAIRRGSGQVAAWYVRTTTASTPVTDRKARSVL